MIDGVPRSAWYEVDPATGATIGVLDDGSHGITESVAAQLFLFLQDGAIEFIAGYLIGWNVGSLATVAHSLALVTIADPSISYAQAKDAAVAHAQAVVSEAREILTRLPGLPIDFPFLELGFELATSPVVYLLSQDPPLEDTLVAPAPNPAFDALGGPGLDLGIEPESLLYLPVAGAAVPTLFRLGIHNGGATEQIYNLSFDALPPGFTAQTSVPSVPVAPGETAEVGVCLRPSGPLGAPGSNAAFTVRVTPQSNPGGAVTEVEPFLLPAIHGVVIEAAPSELSTAPGTPIGTTITLRSAGNVAESVNLALELPPGLGASGVPPNVMLAKGASTMFAASFTPSAGTPLNTTLTAVLNASFGGIEPTRLEIPVRVGTPGADAIHAASVAARELGENDLAQRLEDLGVALNRLVADPTNAVLRAQALASLSSILSLLGNIQSLAGFIPELEDARDALAAAANGAQVLAAINALGAALDPFADQAEDLAAHAVELLLQPASQAAQPGQPAVFDLLVHNVGTAPTTYNLTAGLVPAGVVPMLSQSSVMLAPDAFSAGITLTLTQGAATELVAGSFRVDVSPAGLPGIVTSVHGSLLGRADFVSVVAVVPAPAFADAGDVVDVSARILNAVNREQPALVSYRVLDPAAQQVFASVPVQTTLTVATSLVTLDLGELDTTGFDPGVHTIEVKVTDLAAVPIPGGLGEAALLIGSPVTAALSVSPEVVTPGDVTVTTTLSIKSLPQPGAPLAVVGELDIATPVFDVAIRGDIAYVCGSGGVHVINVSNRTAPVLVTTKAAFPHTACDVAGNRLIALDRGPAGGAAVQLNGSVTNFDLAGGGTPTNPFRTQTIFFNYEFTHEGVIDGGRLYATTNLVRMSGNDIFAQHGDVFSFDISNTSNMKLDDVLFNTNGTMAQPPLFASGSNFNMFGVVQPDATTLLVGSTTATGGDTQTGDGILRIVDVSNPLALAEDDTFTIPGTTQVQGIALEGDLALVVASEGGWLDPFVTASDIGPTGNLVLATLDVSDPRNPVLLDTHTVVRAARGIGGPVALGFGQFLFWNLGQLADTPQLFRVNASDPLAIAVSAPVNLTDPPRRGDVDASYLYLADGHGLTIFSFHNAPTPITAEVRIPNDGSVEVVPGSFSIAPGSVVPSVGFDTLTWTLQNGATLTWNALLDDMLPGERREVALGATVDFVYSATPGSIELPEIAVAAEQILAIDPPARTVAPGVTTSYDLTVRNPTASAKNYSLAVQALPPAWVDLPSAVMVPAHSESVLPLEVTPDGFAVLGDYEFSVLATSSADRGLGVGDARSRRSRRFPDADAGRGGRRRRAHSVAGDRRPGHRRVLRRARHQHRQRHRELRPRRHVPGRLRGDVRRGPGRFAARARPVPRRDPRAHASDRDRRWALPVPGHCRRPARSFSERSGRRVDPGVDAGCGTRARARPTRLDHQLRPHGDQHRRGDRFVRPRPRRPARRGRHARRRHRHARSEPVHGGGGHARHARRHPRRPPSPDRGGDRAGELGGAGHRDDAGGHPGDDRARGRDRARRGHDEPRERGAPRLHHPQRRERRGRAPRLPQRSRGSDRRRPPRPRRDAGSDGRRVPPTAVRRDRARHRRDAPHRRRRRSDGARGASRRHRRRGDRDCPSGRQPVWRRKRRRLRHRSHEHGATPDRCPARLAAPVRIRRLAAGDRRGRDGSDAQRRRRDHGLSRVHPDGAARRRRRWRRRSSHRRAPLAALHVRLPRRRPGRECGRGGLRTL